VAPVNKLLPPNATDLERNLVAVTERTSDQDISGISGLWNADTCPLNLLPWLAWAEGVQEWSSQWAENVQRQVIKTARATRRKRGTAQAVRDAVAAFGGIAVLREWFDMDPPGSPGTFDVTITGGADYVEAGLQEAMIASIWRNKNARSHFVLNIGLTALANVNVVSVAHPATYLRLNFTE